MPSRTAVHLSTARDPVGAGREAAAGAVSALGARPDLALVFATAGYAQPPLLAAIRAELGPGCVIAGCSGEGVIAAGDSREVEHAVTVMVVRFDATRADALLIEGYAQDSASAARELARRIEHPEDVRGILVFPDGLSGDCPVFWR